MIKQRLAFFAANALFIITIMTLFFPAVRLLANRYEVNQVAEQWQNNKPLAYQVTVWQRGLVEEPESCLKFFDEQGYSILEYEITVVDGKVTSSNAPLECKPLYEQLTIEKSFNNIDQALREANPILATSPTMEVDPVHHLVTHFYISQAETVSSSSPSEWHERFISYDNFKVLDAPGSTMPKP